MKIMIDLNVLLDVVQKRQSHYQASAQTLDFALRNQCGCLSSHVLTTCYYLVAKYADQETAEELIDWLLQNFTIIPANKETFLLARCLNFTDFEDAVVSACAEEQHCDYIITRNSKDFKRSHVQALSPAEFLARINPIV
uniref:type II toxin-antitoxin system VapC family toxin n=1 Tax=Candidatus Electrothrix sp. TaxID=2170559 RepID=UPI0040570053